MKKYIRAYKYPYHDYKLDEYLKMSLDKAKRQVLDLYDVDDITKDDLIEWADQYLYDHWDDIDIHNVVTNLVEQYVNENIKYLKSYLNS